MRADAAAPITQEQINQCITVLESLLGDTTQLFELPEEQRIALLKAAGALTRPDRAEFDKRRKDAKKAAKRKMVERDKHIRKTTGIRSARESVVLRRPN